MFANERRLKIIELLNERQSLTASWLMEEFGVSIETIRRDLEYLENQGALKRVHGGAVSLKKMQNYGRLSSRVTQHKREKQQLSAKAVTYIEEGSLIAIDSGSTGLELALSIRNIFHNLTILTNSLEMFGLLSQKEGLQVILTGGYYHKSEKSFYGHLTIDFIRQLHVSKYFLTPSALSLQFGISDFIPEIIPVQREMLSIADEVFVLADSSKFETNAGLKICDLSPAFTYLTDSNLPDGLVKNYEEHGIKIIKGE